VITRPINICAICGLAIVNMSDKGWAKCYVMPDGKRTESYICEKRREGPEYRHVPRYPSDRERWGTFENDRATADNLEELRKLEYQEGTRDRDRSRTG
jgi:hypothetical protein